jgi:AraC-like DNA-binding protein
VDSHFHVARELADHNLLWKRGAVDVAMFKGSLERLQLFVLRYGAEVEVTPKPFEDFALVHMSLRGAAEIESDGKKIEVAEGRAAVIAPKRAIRLRWHDGTEQLILKVPKSLIREVGSHEDGEDQQFSPGYLIPQALGSHWELLMRSLLNVMRLPRESGPRQTWLEHFERNVVLFLLAHQPESSPATSIAHSITSPLDLNDDTGSTRDSRRMDALLKYMKSRLCAPISLFDLAAAAGVSVRTLNGLCQHHTGSSPMELLRNMRLDAVHSKLLLVPSASITDTALEFGFGHLGRFAAYYSERFGELPRQTFGNRQC